MKSFREYVNEIIKLETDVNVLNEHNLQLLLRCFVIEYSFKWLLLNTKYEHQIFITICDASSVAEWRLL